MPGSPQDESVRLADSAASAKLRSQREFTRWAIGPPQRALTKIPCNQGLRVGLWPRTMSFLASLLNLGGPDLIWILLLILLLFGAKKLPELARGMGQAIKEFQKAKDVFSDELHKAGQP